MNRTSKTTIRTKMNRTEMSRRRIIKTSNFKLIEKWYELTRFVPFLTYIFVFIALPVSADLKHASITLITRRASSGLIFNSDFPSIASISCL